MQARSILQFKGKNAVIGCPHDRHGADCKCLGLHHPASQFFYINTTAPSDLIFNLSKKPLPGVNVYQSRFTVTLVENLHAVAYTPLLIQNIRDMTCPDGFIFLKSCPQESEFRKNLKHLRYIELANGFEENGCVLIANDQSISDIATLRDVIQMNKSVMRLIHAVTPVTKQININEWQFCDEDVNNLPTSDSVRNKRLSVNLSLETLKKDKKIASLFQSLDTFRNYALNNPTYNMSNRNTILDMANDLREKTNVFFAQPVSEINDKMAAFKKEMETKLSNITNENLIQSNADLLRIVGNILVALLPLIGIAAISYQMYNTKKSCGRYMPLFFSEEKYLRVKKIKDDVIALPASLKPKSLST